MADRKFNHSFQVHNDMVHRKARIKELKLLIQLDPGGGHEKKLIELLSEGYEPPVFDLTGDDSHSQINPPQSKSVERDDGDQRNENAEAGAEGQGDDVDGEVEENDTDADAGEEAEREESEQDVGDGEEAEREESEQDAGDDEESGCEESQEDSDDGHGNDEEDNAGDVQKKHLLSKLMAMDKQTLQMLLSSISTTITSPTPSPTPHRVSKRRRESKNLFKKKRRRASDRDGVTATLGPVRRRSNRLSVHIEGHFSNVQNSRVGV